MTRGTTPTLSFNFGEDFDYSLVEKAELTIRQNRKKIIYDLDKGEDCLFLDLDETDTLQYVEGFIELQIKLLLTNGKVVATDIQKLFVKDILNEETMNEG